MTSYWGPLALLLLLATSLASGDDSLTCTDTMSEYENSKIVGGLPVDHGDVPYLVSLRDTRYGGSQHICGGSIYDSTHIITAANCVDDDFSAAILQVVAGEHDITKDEGYEQTVDVSHITIHSQFDPLTYLNDIAILKLKHHLSFNDYVQPIPLPPYQVEASGDCLVSGWGAVEEFGDAVSIPHQVTVPIWLDANCRDCHDSYVVDETMVCAGYAEGEMDACHKDNGGPLVCKTSSSSSYLAGIVSWGHGCARPLRPGVYTEVSHFKQWIIEHV